MSRRLIRTLYSGLIIAVTFFGIYLPQQVLAPLSGPQAFLWPTLAAIASVALFKMFFIRNDYEWDAISWFDLPWLPSLYIVALEGLFCALCITGLFQLAVSVPPHVLQLVWPLAFGAACIAALIIWYAFIIFAQVFALRFPKRKEFLGETLYHFPLR